MKLGPKTYEIHVAYKKDDGDLEPFAPIGYGWKKMRGRPRYKNRVDAEAELEGILSKSSAKPREFYRIMEITGF